MSIVDNTNPDFKTALSFINQTSRHIFLTGKAGTGKTTFLRYIKETGFKKMAVVAPTGVAAINAGGVTVHSFFQIPPGTYLPIQRNLEEQFEQRIITKHSLLKHLRISAEKKELIRELELLVIDEVSMVRCDLLDAIDTVLRHVRQLPMVPFGGVQVLFIGDLFQLPPVVKHDEWRFLQEFYVSPFFFNALVMEEAESLYIELKKVYRQKDDAFIDILNNIRNNCCTDAELKVLHKNYLPSFQPAEHERYITLTTHNSKADLINQNELRQLRGKVYQYPAEIRGDFPDHSFPAERLLQLKEGAQVMFIKNDKGEARKYFNGKIGTIHSIKEKQLLVSFPNEPGFLELEKETWQNIRYLYNKDKDEIEEEELGSFSQYPIRLAWAITIHKSQGLTFEKAVIDAGESFASGQVYVALSRLTALDGLVLKSRIHKHCIHTDERVLHFVQQCPAVESLQQTLEEEQKVFLQQTLLQRFGWDKLLGIIRQHIGEYAHRIIPGKDACIHFSQQLLSKAEGLQEVSLKFQKQLGSLLNRCAEDQYMELDQRLSAACSYFIKEMDEKLIKPLTQYIEANKIKNRIGRYVKELIELKRQFDRRKQQFEAIQKMSTLLLHSQNNQDVLLAIEELHKPVPTTVEMVQESMATKSKKRDKGQTNRISLKMFKEGQSIADIASARNMVYGTIESHLTGFIITGEIDVLELVNQAKLEKILNVLEEQPGLSSSIVKEQLGESFSYGEIRAAVKFLEKQELNRITN